MPAYMIAYRESPIRDPDAMEEYWRMNRENAEAFQAKFQVRPLVMYGSGEAPEGSLPDAVILVEFPSVELARAWYASPEYQASVPFRKKAADWRIVIVAGL